MVECGWFFCGFLREVWLNFLIVLTDWVVSRTSRLSIEGFVQRFAMQVRSRLRGEVPIIHLSLIQDSSKRKKNLKIKKKFEF